MEEAGRVTLVGHPFAATARGEDLRAIYRALKMAGFGPRVVDVHTGQERYPDLEREIGPDLTDRSGAGIDVFIIDGDEIAPVLDYIGSRQAPAHHSILVVSWDLPIYPVAWADRLARFDSVWVPSAFVRNAVASATRRQAQVMPGAAGLSFRPFLGRRHFGLPESSFVFLVTFDLRSSVERYNPMAAVEAFVRLCQSRPSLDTALVVKMSGATDRPAAAVAFREALAPRTSAAGLRRVILLERELTGNETKNLVRCSDAVVSLHRSEGSGRWLADAMLLGKPVVATNYSGNVDFMTPDVACLVGYDLIPVQPEAHPFWQGQVWADPDVEEAAHWMRKITDDSRWRRVLGDRASRHVRKTLSHRAIGLRLADQLAPLAKTRTAGEEIGSVRGGVESGGEA